MSKLFLNLAMVIASVVVAGLLYAYFWESIMHFFVGEQPSRMYVESAPISVLIANEEAERIQGLSGREALGESEGMLFVFPKEDYYGMWMKDMEFAIDILWIDNASTIVHIEENVSPDTYPKTFVSDTRARFVLEVPAFFADRVNVVEGDTVRLPADAVPRDLLNLPE